MTNDDDVVLVVPLYPTMDDADGDTERWFGPRQSVAQTRPPLATSQCPLAVYVFYMTVRI